MRSSDHRKSEHLYAALGGTIAAALAITAIIGGSLRLADALRPQTGDIIAFVPAHDEITDTQATIIATRAGQSPPASCVLDPRIMHQSGGSLIIEAVGLAGHRAYRVHWAGVRTSASGTDCGRSADLLLSPEDVAVLLFAASSGNTGADVAYSNPGMGRRVR